MKDVKGFLELNSVLLGAPILELARHKWTPSWPPTFSKLQSVHRKTGAPLDKKSGTKQNKGI